MKKINQIVIIDDNKIDLFINQRICSQVFEKATIKLFHSSEMALNYFKIPSNKADFILLDINMPVINGFEVLKEMENTTFLKKNKVEVYFLSSSNLITDMNEAYSIKSCSGYIEKPLTKEKLVNAISSNDKHVFDFLNNSNKLNSNRSNDVA